MSIKIDKSELNLIIFGLYASLGYPSTNEQQVQELLKKLEELK